MSDIKLFALGEQVTELTGSTAALEKDLQRQIENQMDSFLGVRFLATEYTTGKSHNGRIDSLGLDENNCPVIVEYKRHSNENVINQGLFYLDWLLDHQSEFRWLVMELLGRDVAEQIEWGGTRLICIASDFNKYDEHAVQQINRNIELMRYRYFGQELLLLELINAQTADRQSASKINISSSGSNIQARRGSTDKTQAERLAEAPEELQNLYDEICSFTEQLGDEVQRKELKLYTAFKRIRNFISVLVLPQNKDPRIQVYLKLPGDMAEDNAFSRDMSRTGHWGTGDLEVNVRDTTDLSKAKELIEQCYAQS